MRVAAAAVAKELESVCSVEKNDAKVVLTVSLMDFWLVCFQLSIRLHFTGIILVHMFKRFRFFESGFSVMQNGNKETDLALFLFFMIGKSSIFRLSLSFLFRLHS